MSLARDLPEQAGHLASRESKRPKQASLRRAVSAAYYAIFDLLIRASAFDAAPGSPPGLRELVARSLGHADIRNVCRGFVAANAAYLKSIAPGATKPFQTGDIPPSTQTVLVFPLEPDLILVMRTFLQLGVGQGHAQRLSVESRTFISEDLGQVNALAKAPRLNASHP